MRVAAVDIGTNTVRLLVADVAPASLLPPRVQWIDHRTTVTRLGAGVDGSGGLSAAAVDRTVAALRCYGDVIRSWQCEAMRAVATSATRDATNRNTFLDRAELALGLRPDVIDGTEEARLSFGGTIGGAGGAVLSLVIDPGGGSTEFVFGTNRPDFVASVNIGSVRISERLLPDRPARADQLAAARTHADELFADAVALPSAPGVVLGVGGTFTSLAAIYLDLGAHDSQTVHGTVLAGDTLGEMTDRFASMTVEETESIPSLDPARAPVLLGGAVVAERAVRHVGVAGVTVSERDLLDGVALSLVT